MAYALLGATLSQRKIQGWSTDPAADASRAIAYAKSALRLGRQDPLVLAQSAIVLTSIGYEVELADSLLEEAIRLNPNGMLGWGVDGRNCTWATTEQRLTTFTAH